ncbi:DNA cytosine methyltransferase [Bradyrhizobium sp.]
MNELALFAGAGGGILGSKLLGWRTICAVEVNSFCARRLMQRQNEGHLSPFPIWDDVCTFDGLQWRGYVDVVSGGFPCQRYSKAARGRNNADDLWPEMRRVVADVAPRYVWAENVAWEAIDAAADDLEKMGYKTAALPFAASDMGADHIRQRYWLLAYSDNKGELLLGINAEMAELSKFRPRIWEAFPGDSRMVDGVAHRVDRYRATGNGQLPNVVVAAFMSILMRIEDQTRRL